MAGRRSSTLPGNPEPLTRFLAVARSLLAAWLIAACAATIGEAQVPAGGGGPPSPDPPAPPAMGDADLNLLLNEQDLFLEVFRGDQATGLVMRVRMAAGRMSAAAADLRSVGVIAPADPPLDAAGLIPLDALPGLTYSYERATQRLILQVPALLRPVQRLGYKEPAPVEAIRHHGLLLGYDLHARALGESRGVGAVGDARWFGRAGTLEVSGTARAVSGGGIRPRFDARWSYSDPERMWRWTAGDLVSGTVAWSRPARMAGLQWRRDFGVRPGFIRSPIPRFSTEIADASTVDLFVNDLRLLRSDVEDGPFMLDVSPGLSGAGRASLVVTDGLGRVTKSTIPFYADHRRLARGLTEFSLEAGLLRQGFFSGSTGYGRSPVASASWRRGMTDTFTLEGHGEVGDDQWLLGLGAVWSPGGRWGLLSASYARGEGESRGGQYTLGYQWNTPRYGFDLRTLRRDPGFRDLADLAPREWTSTASLRAQDQASFRLRIPRGGLTLNWQRSLDGAGRRWERLSLSSGLSLHSRLSVSASAFSYGHGGHGGALTASIPIGRRLHASASVRNGGLGASSHVSLRRGVPYGGGVGWDLEGSDGADGRARAAVEVLGRYGEVRLGAAQVRDATEMSFRGSGSIAFMEGRMFVSRRIRDAFAIVSTGGIAGVPILSENRLYGRTGRSGHLLIPTLGGWRTHQLAIQPDSLGFGYRFGQLRESVIPPDRGGVLVTLPVSRVVPAVIALLGPDGTAVPAGRRARVVREERAVLVGYDGEVYLDDTSAETIIELDLSGSRCRYRLPAAAGATGQRRETLACEAIDP